MSTLLDLNTFTDKARLVNKLKGFLSHEHYIVHGNNESIYLLCYYRLAKYYGMQADYKEVISLCDEALVLAKKRQLYYLLDYFYYFKSLSYHRLNDTQKRDDFLALLYAVLIAQENPAKFQKFASLIQKDYALDLTSHALHVLQNKTP